jgi:hypothetical protein
MRHTARRAGLAATATMLCLVTGVQPASAATPAGAANLGSAAFTKAGVTSTIPVQAPCAIEGPTTATSEPVSKPGVTFGGGTSTCSTTVTDPDSDITTTTSTATGRSFELSALVSLGGPRLRITSYEVTCTATQNQAGANWSMGGISGITALPSPLPANYVKPLTKADGTVLANATFNIQNAPGDGGLSLTMMRIDFTPASGISGSVTLGTAGCSPTP